MTVFDSGGFEDLRSYIQSNWTHAEFIDDSGSVIFRLSISGDGRLSWTSGSASNPLTLESQFTGSDSDISLPVTFRRVDLYKGSGATTRMGNDTHIDATLEASADSVTITTDVEMPNL
jgi:hypothetical protein